MSSNHARSPQISDRWLRIFNQTYETGSFTDAARRLDIGQSAVSHAIRHLESALGVRLFERGRNGVAVTEAGSRLREHVSAGFAELDRGVRTVMDLAHEETTVTLSVSTSLASFWLLPRLPACKRVLPHLELRCLTCDTDVDVGRDGADLWIPHGAGPWPGLDEVRFTSEEIMAVAAPTVAAMIDGNDPAALLHGPLLHLEERYSPRFDWQRWFDHHEVPYDGTLGGSRSNDYSLILQAALDGQGVALGWHHIVGPLLRDGRLMKIGDQSVRTDRPFTIVTRLAPTPAVAELRDWLIGAVAYG